MTDEMTFEKPRQILCVLGNWKDFEAASKLVARVGGEGYALDLNYSELEPDDRMLMSFNVCMDRVTPSMTEEDWAAVEDHTAVAYILSPYMEPDSAIDISAKMLAIAGALLENGGVAAKAESAGIAHGAEKWKQMSRDLEGQTDQHVKLRILYDAWVRRPISTEDQFYSVGMHVLGQPDIQVNACADLKSVQIIDSFAQQILKLGRASIKDGDTVGDRIVRLAPCQRYEIDEPKHNPYGCVHLEKVDKELSDSEKIEKHKACNRIRLEQFNELFGCEPALVFNHDEFPERTDAPLIDVFIYQTTSEGEPVYIMVTSGMSDEALTDPRAPGIRSRVELIQYFRSYEKGHAQHLQDLAWLPHFDGFLLQPLDSIAWPVPAIEGSPWNNAIFLPPPIDEHSEFSWEHDDEPCSFLWHIPISDEELEFKRENDTDALLDLMYRTSLPWLFDESERQSMLVMVAD